MFLFVVIAQQWNPERAPNGSLRRCLIAFVFMPMFLFCIFLLWRFGLGESCVAVSVFSLQQHVYRLPQALGFELAELATGGRSARWTHLFVSMPISRRAS